MKIKALIPILLLFISAKMISQTKGIINPKGNWFFGAEIGLNTITSFSFDEPNKYFQGGFITEYYFAKHWSAIGRVKYFKTGLSFANESAYGEFNGAVISVPIDIKWEFRLLKNLRGNFKLGLAYNYETKSDYNFSSNLETDFSKSFLSLNSGFGLNYFISKKISIYIDFEQFSLGAYKGKQNPDGLDLNINPFEDNYTKNNIWNIGVKYNYKK